MKIDILLRAKYDDNFPKLDRFIVIIKDRYSANNQEEINGSLIKDVTKGHFTLKDGTYIPAHRIVKVKEKK